MTRKDWDNGGKRDILQKLDIFLEQAFIEGRLSILEETLMKKQSEVECLKTEE